MKPAAAILDYSPQYQPSIRRILAKIGWAEQYASSAEQNMRNLSEDKENYGVYVALRETVVVFFTSNTTPGINSARSMAWLLTRTFSAGGLPVL
jgi:hypothetical protein